MKCYYPSHAAKAMHGSYVIRNGERVPPADRKQLMDEYLQREYCYSQPLVPIGGNLSIAIRQQGDEEAADTVAATTTINYTSVDVECRKYYDVWNDINIENEWEFEYYGPSWTRVNYEGCRKAHQRRMVRNNVQYYNNDDHRHCHQWDINEIMNIFLFDNDNDVNHKNTRYPQKIYSKTDKDKSKRTQRKIKYK